MAEMVASRMAGSAPQVMAHPNPVAVPGSPAEIFSKC
jgi:hypothetical protein